MRRFLALFVALPLLGACGDGAPGAGDGAAAVVDTLPGGAVRVRNPERGVWDSARAWRPVVVARIGSAEGTDPALTFARIGDLGIDPLGRVWVLEVQAKELRVFEPGGRHVRTVGREGGGPGELRNPTGLAWGAAGSVWVSDPAKPAFTRFVLDDRGHLWVAATTAGSTRPRWDVFDSAGRYLGAVDLDLDLHPLPRIVGNTVVGVKSDELDVPYVVVYRLEGRPAP